MEQETTDEEQALYAIKLAENVRKLIRDEIKLALEDHDFRREIAYNVSLLLDPAFGYCTADLANNNVFRNAVFKAVSNKLNAY